VHGEVDDHATFDMRGGNGPTRVIAIDRISSPDIAALMAATAGLNRSTCPTISVTPARRGGVDNVPPLLDRGRDRLFNEDVNLAGDAGERDLMMKVGRRGDGHGIDTFRDQLVQARETAAAGQVVSAGPVRRQRSTTPTSVVSGRPASTRAWLLPSRLRR